MNKNLVIPFSVFSKKVTNKEQYLSFTLDKKIGLFSNEKIDIDSISDFFLLEAKKNYKSFSLGILNKDEFQKYSFTEDKKVFDFILDNSFRDYFDIIYISNLFGFDYDLLNQKVYFLDSDQKEKLFLLIFFLRDLDFIIVENPHQFLNLENQILIGIICRIYSLGYLVISDDFEYLIAFCDFFLFFDSNKIYDFKNRWWTLRKKIKNKFFKPLDDYSLFLPFLQKLFYIFWNFFKNEKVSLFKILNQKEISFKLNKNQIYYLDSIESGFLKKYWEDQNGIDWFYLSYDYIKNYSFSGSIKEFFYSFEVKRLSFLEINIIKYFYKSTEILNRNFDLLNDSDKMIFFIFALIFRKDKIVILDRLARYLSLPYLLKLSFILRIIPTTIFFIDDHISFSRLIYDKVIFHGENLSKIQVGNFKKYLLAKYNNLFNSMVSNRYKVIHTYQNLRFTHFKRKNGYNHFKRILDENDIKTAKKSIFYFFNKDYKLTKKEIERLREELKWMEAVLKELRKNKEELLLLMEQYQMNTPENIERMNQLEEKLHDLERKYEELNRKIKELDQE